MVCKSKLKKIQNLKMNKSISEQTKQFSLSDFCVYFEDKKDFNIESKEVDKFVGLKYINKKLEIHFPVGYERPEKYYNLSNKTEIENQTKKDIASLIGILSHFGKKEKMLKLSDIFSKRNEVNFPIHAYIFIIKDFLSNGIFKEKEKIYKKSTNGKIAWNRTIKQIKPQFINETPIYLEFITQNTNYNEEELIYQIHQYCVFEAFSKLGFLFTAFRPEKPKLKFNQKLFSSIIKMRSSKTFNQDTLLLFKNMLDLINYLDNTNENENFIFGTTSFHHIFEQMVDSLFGESDKDKFYPQVFWKLNNFDKPFNGDSKRNSLRPDTIMITNRGKENQEIFVLDSKYYRYGETKNPNHLPDSSSVVKQIAYAEYIENFEKSSIPKDVKPYIKSSTIYNAFIMPGKKADDLLNIGFASADYVVKEEKPYHKIYGILLDIRSLMNHHSKSPEKILNLQNVIVS